YSFVSILALSLLSSNRYMNGYILDDSRRRVRELPAECGAEDRTLSSAHGRPQKKRWPAPQRFREPSYTGGSTMRHKSILLVGGFAAGLLLAQNDWPMYGHDPGASRFSPLKQINLGNVTRLQRAWTFHTGKPGSEGIPIVVGGVMYLAAANGIFAVEPET